MNNYLEIINEIDTLKSRLDSVRPLENQSVLHALDIEYTYDSNRIEGNTLTLRETQMVIDKGLTISGKPMREHLEAINHYDAVVFLRDIATNQLALTESIVRQIHSLVLHGIDRDNAGKYRGVPVMISGSKHIPPQPWQVPILMENMFAWYEENKADIHPIILAAEIHERIATIHPFIDGNGRTARLIMNMILLSHGYPIVNISGDAENRMVYYNALEECNVTGNKKDSQSSHIT
ncbi:MAG: Fic family protein [bacterium]